MIFHQNTELLPPNHIISVQARPENPPFDVFFSKLAKLMRRVLPFMFSLYIVNMGPPGGGPTPMPHPSGGFCCLGFSPLILEPDWAVCLPTEAGIEAGSNPGFPCCWPMFNGFPVVFSPPSFWEFRNFSSSAHSRIITIKGSLKNSSSFCRSCSINLSWESKKNKENAGSPI